MRLQSIEQKTTNKYLSQLGTLALAAALAIGALGWLMSAFSLSFGKGGVLGGGLKGGMIRIWNDVCDVLGNSDYVLLTKYSGAGQGSGLFLILIGLVLVAFGYAALRSRKAWLLLIYIVPFFTIQLLWDVRSSLIAAMIFLGAAACAVVYCLHPDGGKVTSIILLACMMGVCSALGALLTEGSGQRPELINQAHETARQTLESFRYGSNARGDGSLTPKDFNSKETALELKMDFPDSMYLRGFVGSNYEDGSWVALQSSRYYKQRGLFYWLNKDGFSGLTQLSADSQLIKENRKSGGVGVTNKAASRKYLYLPYELADSNLADTKNWSDSFLTTEGFQGNGSYNFKSEANMVKNWPELAAKLFTRKKGEDLEQYRLNESYYNVQMYKDYAQLSTEQKRLIMRYMGSAGDQEKGHIDYKKAIKKIQKYLEEKFIYTENIKENEDPVEKFLKEKKGCDVHYASAATLMFRYYGIPARYVEGYIVTPEDVKGKKAGDTVSVPVSNNHAWTEIYIDSFGWVPIEVTPEYYGKMEQPDLSKGLENQGAADALKNKRQNKKDLKETNPSSDDHEKVFPWKWILLILAADLLLVLLIYLIGRLLQWMLFVRRRKKAFHDPNVKRAICAIYTYMMGMDVIVGKEASRIGSRAAFSPYEMKEEDRTFMLSELERMKKEKHETKNGSHCYGDAPGAGRRWLRRKRSGK